MYNISQRNIFIYCGSVPVYKAFKNITVCFFEVSTIAISDKNLNVVTNKSFEMFDAATLPRGH